MGFSRFRRALGVLSVVLAALFAGVSQGLLGVCGPFTDVAADAFCPFVLEIYYLGITAGTTATTYDPTGNVTRLQMAAFLSRTVDGSLRRGSRRAALGQFWTTQNADTLGVTTLAGAFPDLLRSDGGDVWVANFGPADVVRVRASDGKLLETWTGATNVFGIAIATGRVVATGDLTPGRLYAIDPSQPAGAVTTVASTLGNGPLGIAFDGARFWTANSGASASIVTPAASIPWTVTTVGAGFVSLRGALFDGSNVWVTDATPGTLLKLDAAGAVLQTVTVGASPQYPVFDGSNIWVPDNLSSSITVVRASSGAVLATLTGNGLSSPYAAAFDGQRVLVTNNSGGGDNVSLWKAADLSPIGSFPTGVSSFPTGATSDGIHFWITLNKPVGLLARF